MVPFFIFYSMFGFQRIGDLIWAAGDMRCRGFLVGATAGRTTLAGEGLQHQDGHSHLLAYSHPHVVAYDPCFSYEIAEIIEDGLRRMYVDQEGICYYLTVENEPYAMPKMPEGSKHGILEGAYAFRRTSKKKDANRVKLLGSGAIMNEVLRAQEFLHGDFGVESEAWAVTSYQQLFRQGLEAQRHNRLRTGGKDEPSYVERCFGGDDGALTVAASDYTKALPFSIRHWVAGDFVGLGTDGFGRSEGRRALRDYFEVDWRHVAWGTLAALARRGELDAKKLNEARKKLQIDPGKAYPGEA
jgi:pyruvate dehydrogenase E1 component